ncbi:MAG: tetratricopeptide repeat protein [Candidatus Binatia bacterium]
MRPLTIISFLFLLIGFSAPQSGEAASIAEISARARQAQGQVGGKARGDFNAQQQAIQILGPVALDLLSASDLARAVADPAQKPLVRNVYDILSGPLEEIYNRNFSHIKSMQKAVMDQDGDLDALYETQQWKEAQFVASRSLYFLNWLHYVGASLFDADKKKKLLQEAADGFSEFVAGDPKSQIRRESLLGRGLCYRELKKFDLALRDFEALLKDDSLPADMQRKARLGMIEAAAQAGEEDKAIAAADQVLAQGTVSADQLARVRAVRTYALQQKQGGSKKKLDEVMAAEAGKGGQPPPDESQFLQWAQAKGHLQKSEFNTAIPLLKEVVASADPKAAEHKHEARYLLGVCLFKGGQLRESAEQLGEFLSADGKPPKAAKFGAEAAYLRFKATESLYARQQSEENTRLYLDAAKDFIRREPGHPSVFEAHFRLGEYNQHHEQYLPAIEAYRKVAGDPAFRTRADFNIVQSYFSLLESENGKRDGAGLSEKALRQRIAASLQTFWKSSNDLEKKNPALAKQRLFHEQRGKVSVMNAVFLSQEDKDAKAPEVIALLQDFERKYPDRKDAFAEVTRMRLVALEKTGRFADLEKEVEGIFTRFKPEQQKELLAGLTLVLPRDIKKLEQQKDQEENTLAAKRTLARLHADRLQRGEKFAEDESVPQFKYELAQLYLDVKAYDKAKPIYQELRTGAYSLASLAGLAQIAEVEGKQREAVGYWEQMLKETQVGDPLWFRGTFEVARLNAAAGNADLACKTVNSTRPMLNRLGDQGLKKKIQTLATQSCSG